MTDAQILEQALERTGSSKALAERMAAMGVVSPATRKPIKAVGIRSWRHAGSVPPAYVPTLRAIAASEAKPAVPLDALPPGHRLRGVSTLIGKDGETKIQWVKTARDREAPEAVLERLLRELPSKIPVRPTPISPSRLAPRVDPDRLAVYPLGDPHVGLLAWGKETGADFDLQICEDLMVSAMRDLVLRGPRTEKALIVNLGDFFHFDNSAMHTTRGDHALDVDGRAPKVLAVGLRIMVALIDAALEHHAQVTVDNRIGNHDAHTSLMLSIALGAYYRNEPRVTIPPTIRHRDYYEFGKVLIGTTHGDRARVDDLASIMAAEAPEQWGRTTHRCWLVGHVHHSQRKEHRGCTVETFRTLAASDSWHAAQGYVSGRDMHRIVYHRTRGEVSREIVNVAALLGSGGA